MDYNHHDQTNEHNALLNDCHLLQSLSGPQKEIHSSCMSARPAHSDNIGFGKQLALLAPANLLRIHFWLASFCNVMKFDCTMLPYKGHGPPVTQSASANEGRKD